MMRTAIVLGLLAAAAVSGGTVPVAAADASKCLSPTERRAAVSEKRAVPLGRAMRAARSRGSGDVLRARLCENDPGLVYRLTLLGRDGKVTQATVDAMTGQLLGPNR